MKKRLGLAGRWWVFMMYMLYICSGYSQGDLYLWDSVTKDTLKFSNRNERAKIWISGLSTPDSTQIQSFEFANTELRKCHTTKLWPLFLDHWKSSAFKRSLKQEARNAKAEYWIEDKKSNERYNFYKYLLPLNLEVHDIVLEPFTCADGILTVMQKVYFTSSFLDDDCVYSRYDMLSHYSVFYIDLNTQRLIPEREFHKSLRSGKLRRALKRKWEMLADSIPAGPEFFIADQTSGLAQLFTGDFRRKVNLYRDIKRRLSWISLRKAKIFWTGAGLMVSFPKGFFGNNNLYEMGLNLHLGTNQLNQVQDIFKESSVYSFVDELELKRPEKPHNFDPRKTFQFFDHTPYAFNYPFFSPFNFLEIRNNSVQSLEMRSFYKGAEENTRRYKLTYKEGKLKEVSGDHRNWVFKWEGEHLQGVREPGVTFSSESQLLTRPTDSYGNILFSFTSEGLGWLCEYAYWAGFATEVSYSLLAPKDYEFKYYNFRTYGFKENSWCIFHSDEGVLYNDQGQVVREGVYEYLYAEDGQVIAKWNHQHNWKLYYEYDQLRRLKKASKSQDGLVFEVSEYYYSGDSEIPVSMENFDPRSEGKKLKILITPICGE